MFPISSKRANLRAIFNCVKAKWKNWQRALVPRAIISHSLGSIWRRLVFSLWLCKIWDTRCRYTWREQPRIKSACKWWLIAARGAGGGSQAPPGKSTPSKSSPHYLPNDFTSRRKTACTCMWLKYWANIIRCESQFTPREFFCGVRHWIGNKGCERGSEIVFL